MCHVWVRNNPLLNCSAMEALRSHPKLSCSVMGNSVCSLQSARPNALKCHVLAVWRCRRVCIQQVRQLLSRFSVSRAASLLHQLIASQLMVGEREGVIVIISLSEKTVSVPLCVLVCLPMGRICRCALNLLPSTQRELQIGGSLVFSVASAIGGCTLSSPMASNSSPIRI